VEAKDANGAVHEKGTSGPIDVRPYPPEINVDVPMALCPASGCP